LGLVALTGLGALFLGNLRVKQRDWPVRVTFMYACVYSVVFRDLAEESSLSAWQSQLN